MALVRCDWFSDVLDMGTSMTVLLPQATQAQVGVPGGSPVAGDGFRTLYLLHGLSDDATAWTRFTSLERYAGERGLAVVMPQVQRSFYTDQAHGGRWWQHLSREVPEVAASFFRLSPRRADTFVAGLSMGGYGAVKWALQQPERFAAAASLSGALDLAGRQQRGDLHDDIADAVLDGRDVTGTDDDLLATLGRSDAAAVAALPRLFVACGTDDHLLPESKAFLDVAASVGADVTTDLRPGAHEWGYWDALVQVVLDWLPG